MTRTPTPRTATPRTPTPRTFLGRALPALLTGVFLLTLGGSPAVAAPAEPGPGTGAASGLVPGIARGPGADRQGLPDRALPPVGPWRTAVEMPLPEPAAGPPRHIEYVPPFEAVPDRAVPQPCSRSTGPAQRQAERYLGLTRDGRQSAADCAAIRTFQKRQHIEPASGFAGPVTGAVLRLLRAQEDPNRAGKCPERVERVVCVDLNRQIVWVQQDEEVIFQPVAMRSGQPTMETRTGTYRIYWRHKDHVSSLYNTPMPFAQFFDGGEALHGIYEDIYAPPGSHGCINLKWSDAKKLWDLLDKGDVVHIWGHRTAL
ncbi:L,D-transpeptidase family protein [Streptomyces sp. NPDC091266]|uniref:L,D-transpeptidase n=1 Tax=Streptomyces sp. NPDC091266 TaxID=3365978 RepID=UPI0038107D01